MPKPTHAALRGSPFPPRPISNNVPLYGHGQISNYTLADLPHPATLPSSLAVHPDFYAQHLSPEGNPQLHALINERDFLPRRIPGHGSAVRCWSADATGTPQDVGYSAKPHRRGTRFITHHRTVVAAFWTGADGTEYSYLHYGISRKTDEVVRSCDTSPLGVNVSLDRGVAMYDASSAPSVRHYTNGPIIFSRPRFLSAFGTPAFNPCDAAHPDTTFLTVDYNSASYTDGLSFHAIPTSPFVLPEPYVAIPGRPNASRPPKLHPRGYAHTIVPPGIGFIPWWDKTQQRPDPFAQTTLTAPLPTFTRAELNAAARDAFASALDPRHTDFAHLVHHQLREARISNPWTTDPLFTDSAGSTAIRILRLFHDTSLAMFYPYTPGQPLRPRTPFAQVKAILTMLRKADNEGLHVEVLRRLAWLMRQHGVPFVES